MNNFKAGGYHNQGSYKSFMPTFINRNWIINDMSVISLLSKADRCVGKLDMFSQYVPNIDLFISMHIIKEATKSSNIEGTQTTVADALQNIEDVPLDKRDDWAEVQNYIKAMSEAVNRLDTLPISARLIKEMHQTLMQGVRGEHKQPGEFRLSQNWIGGTSPSNAIYVPPVFQEVPSLIGDIENFIHTPVCNMPDLIKIALIHYQFETIHPFNDGNGRTGRLLITLYLVSKGILQEPILYLSDYLEKHRRTYYDKLTDAREKNDITGWIKFFLEAIVATAEKGVETLNNLMNLQHKYEDVTKQLGNRSANALKLIDAMYQHPYIDTTKACQLLQITFPSAKTLIEELVKKDVLREVTGAKRGKVYVLQEYLNLFTN